MNILLSSVGRRPYLINWFKEGFVDNNLHGLVIAADSDPNAPARAFADRFLLSPPVSSTEYGEWLKEIIDEHHIELAVSINDFELSVWTSLKAQDSDLPLLTMSPSSQSLVEDKYLMSQVVSAAGINVPNTWLASDAPLIGKEDDQFVTKGRFGSASRGLRFAERQELGSAILSAVVEVTTPSGELALQQERFQPKDLLIVQNRILGTEYGLDVVSDLDGKFSSVLVREKISMRSGETDRAMSVDADPFIEFARSLSAAIPHAGSIDVDVIVDPNGTQHLIDVNPRLGGGYPFSHIAGARIPSAYIAWSAGLPIKESWLSSESDVIGGKYVETARIN